MTGGGAGTERAAAYEALAGSVMAAALDREFVAAAGPQAQEYLQGQLSADVDALAPGQSALSLLLEPQGRLDAVLRVTNLGDERYLLDMEAGWAAEVVERLGRFRLRTKVEFEELGGWKAIALRGPAAGRPAGPTGGAGASRSDPAAGGAAGTVVADSGWPALPGVDLLGPGVVAPDGAALCPADLWEAVRIEAGLPVRGHELDHRTIPAEAGVVDAAVSFTKGCYTGQELVARLDARGSNTPRRLRGLVMTAECPPGATLELDGRQVGTVTSAAVSPALGPVALAYVRREVEPGGEVAVAHEGGTAGAEVRALPLVDRG